MASVAGAEETAHTSLDLQARRKRAYRNLALISLIVTIALIGISSALVSGAADTLRASLGELPGVTTGHDRSQNLGSVGQSQPIPDIIPTCNCQSTQVSLGSTAITGEGHEIVVNLTKQQLYAYDNGQLAFTFLVATGRPELPTPVGRWTVTYKATDITFYSPWPQGSGYYYYPTHINYALLFHDGGFYLHDAWWRHSFGPGSNVYHQNPDGSWETGSHGCVGMTIENAAKLYAWAPVGTSVLIVP